MKIIFDSSPLIYFARSGVIHVLKEIPIEKILPPTVYDEVVTVGRAQGYPDAEITDQLITQGFFSIQSPDEKSIQRLKGLHRELHFGEMEVLALAYETQGIAVIDDRIGREIGEIFQIKVRGSAFILFTLVHLKVISKTEAKQFLKVMIQEGFRIGTEQYAAFIDLLDNL